MIQSIFNSHRNAQSHKPHLTLVSHQEGRGGGCNLEWHLVLVVGASTVKWTEPDSCLMLSKSDSKFYTNFEFYDGKNHRY